MSKKLKSTSCGKLATVSLARDSADPCDIARDADGIDLVSDDVGTAQREHAPTS